MSEFRQDIVTKGWVLIAEGRAKRPTDFGQLTAAPENLESHSPACVFCVGNEAQTVGEIARYPAKGEWRIRVVPNKYEAVSHIIGKKQEDFYVNRPGIGDHEVVVTASHNKPTALQEVGLVDLTLQVYIDRINDLKLHEEVRYVHIIQNHGVQAGASIVHPHSQIFAIPFLPERIQGELVGTRTYFAVNGSCVYCEMILYELKEQERVIVDNPDFLAIAPYASKVPFEIHILPKKHRACFHEITISERKALAQVMKEVFLRLYDRMRNPAYNYYIHTLPSADSIESKTHDDRKSYHWHIVILPRVNVWAGFELGTEVYVNVMPPEKAAKFFH
ncbi:MAG: galactose-1-phosphate uridylyltransferase [Candidatus Doudnabacteria bacterium]|nr:galactose-1-phosphate uridylyltransferase [Candidatus Doudnabacteria bacterium]